MKIPLVHHCFALIYNFQVNLQARKAELNRTSFIVSSKTSFLSMHKSFWYHSSSLSLGCCCCCCCCWCCCCCCCCGCCWTWVRLLSFFFGQGILVSERMTLKQKKIFFSFWFAFCWEAAPRSTWMLRVLIQVLFNSSLSLFLSYSLSLPFSSSHFGIWLYGCFWDIHR